MTRRQLGDALRVLLRESCYDMEHSAEGLIRLHTEAGEVAARDERCWEVLVQVAVDHGVTVSKIRERNQHRAVFEIKHETAWRCRQLPSPPSYPTIARAIGYRNHTSALHGVRRHAARLEAEAKNRTPGTSD